MYSRLVAVLNDAFCGHGHKESASSLHLIAKAVQGIKISWVCSYLSIPKEQILKIVYSLIWKPPPTHPPTHTHTTQWGTERWRDGKQTDRGFQMWFTSQMPGPSWVVLDQREGLTQHSVGISHWVFMTYEYRQNRNPWTPLWNEAL